MWPSSRISSSSRFSSARLSSSVAAPKTRERVLGVHLGGHRREGEDPLDAELLGELDEPAAEGVLARGRLGLADEDDQVVPLLRVVPGEEAAARQPAGWIRPLLDLDVVDVEQVLAANSASRCMPSLAIR